jgi:uncharacterized Tic20 family protein
MSDDHEQTANNLVVEAQVVDGKKYWGMNEKTFCILLHLAQFAYFVPMGGIILPLVMWLTNKEESQVINEHGKHVMNWLISEFIYMMVVAIISVFLFFALFLGLMLITEGHAAPAILPLMFVAYIPYMCLAMLGLIFPIIGAVKASKGICWKYPLTIRFIK